MSDVFAMLRSEERELFVKGTDTDTWESLTAAQRASGSVDGQLVFSDDKANYAGPPIPPLYRVSLEILGETLHVPGPAPDEPRTFYRASLASSQVRVGGTEVALRSLSAVGGTKDEAVQKLSDLAGQGVAQAYVDLIASEDPDEREAARSMEIGRRDA